MEYINMMCAIATIYKKKNKNKMNINSRRVRFELLQLSQVEFSGYVTWGIYESSQSCYIARAIMYTN